MNRLGQLDPLAPLNSLNDSVVNANVMGDGGDEWHVGATGEVGFLLLAENLTS